MSPGDRRDMIEPDHPKLSLSAQCRVLNISRSTLYYRPLPASEETLALMKSIDKLFTKYPFFGSRQIAVSLARDGVKAGRHRVRRLMRLMGLEAVYKRPKTSQPHPAHPVFPYLLKGMEITRPNQVWCSDITFIPVSRGYLYLVAIMNTDQGSQFTGSEWITTLTGARVRVSMDGRGRYLDNIFIERLWRSLKYEAVYLQDIADGFAAQRVVDDWINFYNQERPHAALGKATPNEAYGATNELKKAA